MLTYRGPVPSTTRLQCLTARAIQMCDQRCIDWEQHNGWRWQDRRPLRSMEAREYRDAQHEIILWAQQRWGFTPTQETLDEEQPS